MNTDGAYPHLIEEAIYSVINQTYKDFKLIVVCVHPDGLTLDKDYPNIKIVNLYEPFKLYPEQICFALSLINTDYWCNVDSDDYILPTHLEYLINGIAKYDDATAYGCKNLIIKKDNKITLSNSGWTRCLFESINPNIPYDMLKNWNTHNRFDSRVLNRISWIRYEEDYAPTYIYRKGIATHISKLDADNQERVLASEPLPVITPHAPEYISLNYNFTNQVSRIARGY